LLSLIDQEDTQVLVPARSLNLVACRSVTRLMTMLTDMRVYVQLAVQVAVVFAKIARNDYPRQWPSVFVDLSALMQTGSTLSVRRVYLVLHHILKELSSKRLASDQRNFANVSPLRMSFMPLIHKT